MSNQSVTQSHVNVYTHGDNWRLVYGYMLAVVLVCKPFFALWHHGGVSVLCLVSDDEALPHEWRVQTDSRIQWKVAMTEDVP